MNFKSLKVIVGSTRHLRLQNVTSFLSLNYVLLIDIVMFDDTFYFNENWCNSANFSTTFKYLDLLMYLTLFYLNFWLLSNNFIEFKNILNNYLYVWFFVGFC
jgi:hypothetical protein